MSSLTEWLTGSCAFGGGIDVSPQMPLDSRLVDHHNCSQNWVMVARPLGYEMGVHPSMSSFFVIHHHLPWCRILPLNCRGTPAANIRVASFPHLIHEEPKEPQRTTAELNQLDLGMRACLNKKWGVACREYPFPIYQTEIDRYWDFKVLIFIALIL